MTRRHCTAFTDNIEANGEQMEEQTYATYFFEIGEHLLDGAWVNL